MGAPEVEPGILDAQLCDEQQVGAICCWLDVRAGLPGSCIPLWTLRVLSECLLERRCPFADPPYTGGQGAGPAGSQHFPHRLRRQRQVLLD